VESLEKQGVLITNELMSEHESLVVPPDLVDGADKMDGVSIVFQIVQLFMNVVPDKASNIFTDKVIYLGFI
jgi:hypothetical protein